MPHELEQVFQKLANAGSSYEVVELQLAETTAQVDPKILIVENPKLPAILAKKFIAVLVEGSDSHAGQLGPTQLLRTRCRISCAAFLV